MKFLFKDLHTKMRQAISVWTKYLSPPSSSIGISQLKCVPKLIAIFISYSLKTLHFRLKEGFWMKNMSGSSLKSMLPDEEFSKSACLFCGIGEAAKMLQDANAKDLVVLLMEERADDMPHDTAQFTIQSVQPKFRIFSIALTEKSDPDLDELSNATHGGSDFVPNPTFSRLLMTFASLPVAKNYSIITAKECEKDASCPVEFELDETAENPQSVLQVFMCPTTKSNSSIKLEYDLMNVQLDEGDSVRTLDAELDLETGCWVYQQNNPLAGIWQLKVGAENNTVSVVVFLLSEDYHKLNCYVTRESGIVHVEAHIEPPVENLDRFDVSYAAETGNQIFEAVSLEMDAPGHYTACMRPTNEIGRHAISCKAVKTGVQLLQSQAHSTLIETWPPNGNVCTSRGQTTTAAFSEKEPIFVTAISEEKSSSLKTTEVTVTEVNGTETSSLHPQVVHEKININSTSEEVEEEVSSVGSTAQMIIFVVGAIIIGEIVFILVRCRKKTRKAERERAQVAYPVDPKVNPERRYQKVRSVEAEETV
ncbi:Hypothetical predicted protein [Cloeon dipterum]|uniref:Uncharacterized protein n=1 Tax=Cloeon dipterum TaxID=197152 RepID=A0A8S1CWR9_9INSE|nr:Hypothetical predicted protein [Cloeon dipterum]